MAMQFDYGQDLAPIMEDSTQLDQDLAPWDFMKGDPAGALDFFDDWGRKRTATPPEGEEELQDFDGDDYDGFAFEQAPVAIAERESSVAADGELLLSDRARLNEKLMQGLARALDTGALEHAFRDLHEADVAENRQFHRDANGKIFGALQKALDDGNLESLLAQALADDGEDEAPAAAPSYVPCLADLPGAINTDHLEAALRSLATQEDDDN